MIKIGIIGDIHHHFTAADVAYFNQSEETLLLFVGDLAHFRLREAYPIVERMAQLEKTAFYIPGNHDAINMAQLLGEVKRWPWLRWLGSFGHKRRVHALRKRLGQVVLAGYSTHQFAHDGLDVTVIAARPHAMGGPYLSFAPYLRQQFGVGSLEESAVRLKACVDAAKTERLIFLAHNGPTGLGTEQASIWGKDFRREGGDWGDPDLAEAIDYARALGKEITAVIAGHMHHALRFGGTRRWHLFQDGTHYINAARVPRIFDNNQHHYIRLTLTETDAHVEEILVQQGFRES